MLNEEQLKRLLAAAELATKLNDGPSNEARSKALIRFHYEFSSPSMYAELEREVLRHRGIDPGRDKASEAKWFQQLERK